MSARRRPQRNGPSGRPASLEDRSRRGTTLPAYPARRTGRRPRACSPTSRQQHASSWELRTRCYARPCILRDQSQPDSIFASSHAFPAPDDVTLVVEGPGSLRAERQQSAGVVQPLLDCRSRPLCRSPPFSITIMPESVSPRPSQETAPPAASAPTSRRRHCWRCMGCRRCMRKSPRCGYRFPWPAVRVRDPSTPVGDDVASHR